MGKAKERGPSGLLVIDKPLGMTSHDVVSKTRWIVGTRKVVTFGGKQSRSGEISLK